MTSRTEPGLEESGLQVAFQIKFPGDDYEQTNTPCRRLKKVFEDTSVIFKPTDALQNTARASIHRSYLVEWKSY